MPKLGLEQICLFERERNRENNTDVTKATFTPMSKSEINKKNKV